MEVFFFRTPTRRHVKMLQSRLRFAEDVHYTLKKKNHCALIEFSNRLSKTKIKATTLTNHKGHRCSCEPIKTPSKKHVADTTRGKTSVNRLTVAFESQVKNLFRKSSENRSNIG